MSNCFLFLRCKNLKLTKTNKKYSLIIDKCKTKSGPDPNKECLFPFTFAEANSGLKTYNTCALDATGTPWCPTELPATDPLVFYYGKGGKCPWKSWGYCNKDCPIEKPLEGI